MARLPWTVEEILTATGGSICCGNIEGRFPGIAIDSRTIARDELFVAIRGEVHDGHGFVPAVVDDGVAGVLVDAEQTGRLPLDLWRKRRKQVICIAVSDTTRALGDLAAYNRQRARVSVVGITGSNGKTSTREMTAGIISRRFRTLTPRGNFNNHIGLPLTLLSMEPDHRMAVLEMGMNHAGEIRRLGEICRPDMGVITNIGPAHLEGVGSIEGVARAKGELLETIRDGGTAVLNADDERVAALAENTDHRVCFYGLSQKATVRGDSVVSGADGTRFRVHLPGETVPVQLKAGGSFMVINALAAAAVGHCLGLTADEIRSGLERFEPVHGRLNILKVGQGIHLIDDTYNANPASMAAAIDTLASLRGDNRGIMVAGDMLELGERSAALHRDIGRKAATSGIDRLYVTGNFAPEVVRGAAQAMGADRIVTGTREEILGVLLPELRTGDWVLVKGSRGMRMEKIVNELKRLKQGVDEEGSC